MVRNALAMVAFVSALCVFFLGAVLHLFIVGVFIAGLLQFLAICGGFIAYTDPRRGGKDTYALVAMFLGGISLVLTWLWLHVAWGWFYG